MSCWYGNVHSPCGVEYGPTTWILRRRLSLNVFVYEIIFITPLRILQRTLQMCCRDLKAQSRKPIKWMFASIKRRFVKSDKKYFNLAGILSSFTGASIPPKSMRIPPYFQRNINFPYFRKIYKFPPIFDQFRFLGLIKAYSCPLFWPIFIYTLCFKRRAYWTPLSSLWNGMAEDAVVT